MSLFTTATKSLPKKVDLFSPSDSSSKVGGSSALAGVVGKPANVESGSLDKIAKQTTVVPDTKLTSAKLSDATDSNFSISSLSSSAVKNLQAFIKEDSPIGKKSVKLLDGTIAKGLNTELGEASGFQKMVAEIHDTCKGLGVKDRTTARAVNDTLLLEALLMGLAGLIDCMGDVVGLDFNATRLAKHSVKAAKKGDAASLASVAKMVGSHRIKATEPKIANTLLKNYKVDEGTNPSQFPALGATLVSQLKTIDTDWLKSDVNGGETVTDVSSLRGISPDAKKVLATQNETSTALMIADNTAEESQSDLMGRFNPMSYARGLMA